MITKLRHAQNSWLAKMVLALTALSFISLFGITGYINSAATNPTVIKVNNQVISRQEFDFQVEQELRTARGLFGDEFEVTDEIRKALVTDLIKRNLTEMITAETADKYNVYIGDELVRGIILSQVQFLNEDGSFDYDRFKYFLAQANTNERAYTESIRNDLRRQFLVSNPIDNINVPAILLDHVSKMEAQRREFKYVVIDSTSAKVDRKISEDEVDQFYEDFEAEFTEPEARDVTFLLISPNDISSKHWVSDEEVAEYIESNINDFVIPETRNVLQMVFDNKEDADKAVEALGKGKDFYTVALELARQPKAETELDYVSKDMLLEEVADNVFDAKKGEIVGPKQSYLGWHIMKVTDIKAGSKIADKVAQEQAKNAIKNNMIYEISYNAINEIEDKIGAGATMEEIAKDLGVKTHKVLAVQENGNAVTFPKEFPLLGYNTDFLDTVFSYNEGEISRVVETGEGYVFVVVDKITPSHVLPKEQVLNKIQKIWADTERAAIVLEIVGDVNRDLENSDKIDEVAQRYGLKVNITGPITRAESFAGLSVAQVLEMFNEGLDTPKTFEKESKYIVAVAVKEADPRKLSTEDMDVLKRRLALDLNQSASEQLINAYGNLFDVRVKDRLLGLTQ